MARKAPELQDGKRPTAATDVWALGVVAFQLLAMTGRHPFSSKDASSNGVVGVKEERLESVRAKQGAFNLSALASLPGRAGLKARHLVASCCAPLPGNRPSAAAVASHPLFWSAPAAGERLHALNDRRLSEEALRAALQPRPPGLNEGLYDSLSAWQDKIDARLLAAVTGSRRGYAPGLVSLLRFGRNAMERADETRRDNPGVIEALAGGQRPPGAPTSDAVAEHLFSALPGLALAVHLCSQHAVDEARPAEGAAVASDASAKRPAGHSAPVAAKPRERKGR